MKTLTVSVLQIIIILVLFNYFGWNEFYPPGSFNLCMLAFLCCIVLHLHLYSSVYASIERLRFLLAHKENFEQIFFPFLLCLLKMGCELSVEGIEVLTTYFLSYDELWVIMCYVAFTVIGYIDQQYFSVLDDKMKHKFVDKYKKCLKIENEKQMEKTRTGMLLSPKLTAKEKLYYALLILIEFLYQTVYFYFFPYLAIIYAAFNLGDGE